MSPKQIYYSERYNSNISYLLSLLIPRHVVLPREMDEWRQLGVQQSQGWIHYMIHEPEKTFSTVILLFSLSKM
uniref:Cyclin-dependent kinases regulatory subunit n=1 Tax=Lates calcarifer TaxID=8187 RepID=A0A4W6CB97_LATCA